MWFLLSEKELVHRFFVYNRQCTMEATKLFSVEVIHLIVKIMFKQ